MTIPAALLPTREEYKHPANTRGLTDSSLVENHTGECPPKAPVQDFADKPFTLWQRTGAEHNRR